MVEKCAFCNEEILRNDEEFVCPDCNKHYHKECYECGGCIICDNIEVSQDVKDYIYEKNNERDASEQKLVIEVARRKAEQEKYQAQVNQLKADGKDGYYEYKVISLIDDKGVINTMSATNVLNNLALEGWRLKCAYANEIGKDVASIYGFGSNSTADQNVLILERFVKFK